ncbi:hypothetical protein [Streptomyces sp. NPDC088915]|uniref:hypothetical protein n=1 Tax=Streptomyces sp. NPDC088915 TaxID=3365912 RepID=UPI0037F4B256
MLDVPVWLAVCALAALLCILFLLGTFAVMTLRRADERDIPEALLGLSHVISAMCGLLPWGKPTPPPALPEKVTSEAEPPATPTVVLVREQPAAPVVLPRDPR